jgi:hypothetical protein
MELNRAFGARHTAQRLPLTAASEQIEENPRRRLKYFNTERSFLPVESASDVNSYLLHFKASPYRSFVLI